MRAKNLRKLVGISLAALAMSVSVASPAHASGEDAVMGTVCEAAYYLAPAYYSDNCEQSG